MPQTGFSWRYSWLSKRSVLENMGLSRKAGSFGLSLNLPSVTFIGTLNAIYMDTIRGYAYQSLVRILVIGW